MKRRKAREYALQALFSLEFTGDVPDPAEISRLCGDKGEEATDFCMDIVSGTLRNLSLIDSAITAASEHWVLERMAAVDRNILRVGTYELLFRKDIPPAVVINEAIEIARKFSTTESASFINGILDAVSKRAAPPMAQGAVPPIS